MENPWNINGNYQWTWRFIAGKNLKYRYRDLRWYWQPIVPSLLGTLCRIQWNMPLKWRHHRSNSTTVCQTFACFCKQSSPVIPVCHWYPLIKETIICMMAVSNILQKSCQLSWVWSLPIHSWNLKPLTYPSPGHTQTTDNNASAGIIPSNTEKHNHKPAGNDLPEMGSIYPQLKAYCNVDKIVPWTSNLWKSNWLKNGSP